MRKAILLLSASLIFTTVAVAQSQLTLYQLNSRLPQSNQINPGLFPDYKITVGLPVLSSTYVIANGGNLSFNNAFTRTANDSLRFDPQKLSSSLDENNRLELNANTQLFYLGIRAKKNYFSLALNERVDAGLSYPRTFVQLLASGNGENTGQVYAFDNLGFRAQAYHELALGYGRDITDKLSIGIRGKLLSGIAGVDMAQISAGIATSVDSLHLYSSPISINTAGLDYLDGGDIFQAATAFNNLGFAMDIGGHYWVTDRLRASLSVTDIGSINWSDNTQQFNINEVNYTFRGFDLLTILDDDDATDPVQDVIDSLGNLYEIDTVEGLSYRTKLSPKLYAGASYHLGKHHTFGALFYGDFFKGTFKPAFGLSYNLELGHIWTIGINASYRNNSFNNIGVGTTLSLGPVQIYALTENIMSFNKLADASLVDARVGVNLVFGKIRDEPKIKKRRSKKNDATLVEESAAVIPLVLTEDVTTAVIGTATDELSTGFYVVIASFDTEDEANDYNQELIDEGYAVLSGYQSERNQYYTYLMYYPEDGNKAIEKKNELSGSFAPGLENPWVLWVKEQE